MKALRRLLFTCVLALTTARAIAQTTVTIVATDSSAAEAELGVAANPGSIQVIRTGSTASPLTVWVKVSGIAVQGVDYTFGNTIGSSVVIPAGSSTLNIPVIPIDDWLIEGDEDVRTSSNPRRRVARMFRAPLAPQNARSWTSPIMKTRCSRRALS
jgi:hypothetical protein